MEIKNAAPHAQREEVLSRVFCYRNLNRRGIVWSVRSEDTGLVVDRAGTVYLSGCSFKVSKAGRRRVIRERRKNVHAGVVGRRVKAVPKGEWIRATYDPYSNASFLVGVSPVFHARYVKLTRKGCFLLA